MSSDRQTEEESSGRFYEDFVPGDIYKHPIGRTITDNDNIWYTLMTCNTNPIHFNKDYCEKRFPGAPFNGRLVVNAGLIQGVVSGISVEDTSKHGAMLGLNNLRVMNPVFAGDTLYSESTVLSTRESQSRPEMGIVTIKTRGYNQKGITVIEFERTFLIRKKGQVWKG
jgi:acyl dehydratase